MSRGGAKSEKFECGVLIQPRPFDQLGSLGFCGVASLASLATTRGGSVRVVAWFVVGISVLAGFYAMLAALAEKPARLRLDHQSITLGKLRLPRSDLQIRRARWVDPAYGTTRGAAVTLHAGAASLTLGCRDAALPTDSNGAWSALKRVALVVAREDFDSLLKLLERDLTPGHARAPAGPSAWSIPLVPSPISWRGMWHGLRPLLVVGVAAELLGGLANWVFQLPEWVLAVCSWGLVLCGGWLMLRQGPTPALYRLRIDAGIASLMDEASVVLASSPRTALHVEPRAYHVSSRFGGSYLCPTLWLRWPSGRKVHLGPTESRPYQGTRRRTWRAPALLVAPAEWDALVARLEQTAPAR